MALQTPHKASIQIDVTINDLNAKWNLGLPRLHGVEAENAKKNTPNTASRCSLAIRFLCWKAAKLDSVLEEFTEQAKIALSAWIFKPRQEAGTLLSLPKTKSFIKKDILARQGGKLTSEQREQLLKILLDILSEETRLMNESDVYERMASRMTSRDQSCTASRTSSPTGVSRSFSSDTSATITIANETMPSISPKKREGSVNSYTANGKKQKRQSSLFETWSKDTVQKGTAQPQLVHPVAPSFPSAIAFVASTELTTSFDTVSSSQPDKIFSDDGIQQQSSTNTSMVSCCGDDDQDLLPTQDIQELMNDESFSSNLEAADDPSFSLNNLAGTGPFKKPQYQLPSAMPFWLKYEMHRLALATSQTTRQTYDDIVKLCKCSEPTHENFWRQARTIYSRNQVEKSSRKSMLKEWTDKENKYEKDGRSVYYTGKLELQVDKDLFKFSLNPAKVDRSCRFHRHFGADRFLVINIPYFTVDQLPKRLRDRYKDTGNKIHKIVLSWLAETDHYIAGRTWRAFFLEPEKSQSKKRRSMEGRCQKLHLFAVDGTDFAPGTGSILRRQHAPISLSTFTNWHIPIMFNLDSSDLKLFARFSLGLSKTISTIELLPDEFYHVKDPENGNVMDDGCALISLGLARAIWKEYGDPTMDLPTAFQGRIGGAKGLWVVDFLDSRPPLGDRGYWIEVSDSQLKIKPHPKIRLDADSTQRTFELLKYSKPCSVGHLNAQLVSILSARGVPRQVLRQTLLHDVHKYIDEASEAMQDARKLRAWIQRFHPTVRDHDTGSTTFKGGLPDSREEELCLFLESGFEPKECLHMRKLIKRMMTQELDSYVDKLRITLEYSTNVFCIPDPYGVLAPNEVYLGFSQEWKNPETGLVDTSLDNIDVLVARNPAHLASDIQKRHAVYKRELRHLKNVIVFSRKGDIPTAAVLSGGDYDGDTVTVIWNPEITSTFRNTVKPKLPSEQECKLENKSRNVSAVLSSTPTAAEITTFFQGCLLFNASPDLLGICTSSFEKLIYNTGDISSPEAVKLAALAGYLVDGNKQGWYLSDASWGTIRKETCGDPRWQQPAYKSNGRPRRINEGKNTECQNILDFLKFDVAQKEKDNVLIAFNNSFSTTDSYDIRLSGMYHRENHRTHDPKDPERDAVAAVLKKLTEDLRMVVDQWSMDISSLDEDSNGKEFAVLAEIASERIQAIVPLDVNCDIVRDFKIDGSGKGSKWSLLRASAMYFKHCQKTVVWYTVGDEICRLRARSIGVTRELVPSMHYLLKPDTKLIDKLCKSRAEDDNEIGDENAE